MAEVPDRALAEHVERATLSLAIHAMSPRGRLGLRIAILRSEQQKGTLDALGAAHLADAERKAELLRLWDRRQLPRHRDWLQVLAELHGLVPKHVSIEEYESRLEPAP